MYDKELVLTILTQISNALGIISSRFSPVKSVSDFTDSPQGMEKLDSICMQFIAIGENLKKIDKITNSELLIQYGNIDWKGIKGFRDIISHHYFDIDAEEIFWVCTKELPALSSAVRQIIKDIENK